MTNDVAAGERHSNRWRVLGWGCAVALLALPFIAMQFTSEVDWSPIDFVVMAILFAMAGLAIELAVRASAKISYRTGAAVAALAGFLLVWVNLAVGFLGDEGNPANLLFVAVLAIAAGGAFVARGRPDGMARAMIAAAAVQALIGALALVAPLGSPGWPGVYEAVLGTTLFCGLWLLSAWLFRRA